MVAKRLVDEAPDTGLSSWSARCCRRMRQQFRRKSARFHAFGVSRSPCVCADSLSRVPPMLNWVASILYPISTVVALLGIWYAAVKLFRIPPYLLPLPGT